MEEVRRHFGYTVDVRDERFQELLQKKEKAQKKAMKEAKKLERQKAILNKMMEGLAAEPEQKADANQSASQSSSESSSSSQAPPPSSPPPSSSSPPPPPSQGEDGDDVKNDLKDLVEDIKKVKK